jgi:hypothetical protein
MLALSDSATGSSVHPLSYSATSNKKSQMQKNTSRFTKLTKASVLVLAVAAGAGALQAQTKTAQSIMIDTSTIESTYAISGTESYRLDVDAAALFFTNAWDGVAPTVVISSKGNATEAAALTPAAPAPDASKVIGNGINGNIGKDGIVGENRCTFLDGGTLTGGTYTQSVKVEVGEKSEARSYTYTFTYVVTPTGPVAPFTAWVLQESTLPGTVSVDVVALIAGESVSVSKQNGTKYSFSLLQNDGITIRIQNVGVTLDSEPTDYTGTLTYFDRANTPALNFYYTGNAGFNGTVQGSLLNGDALAILNGGEVSPGVFSPDTFTGNNNGGADGKSLAQVMLSGVSVNLTEGSHTITVNAVVKDNVGALVGNVAVTKTVVVITPGCGGN